MLAAAAKYRRKARQVRALLADPGAGAEDFKIYGPALAKRYEALAAGLKAETHT